MVTACLLLINSQPLLHFWEHKGILESPHWIRPRLQDLLVQHTKSCHPYLATCFISSFSLSTDLKKEGDGAAMWRNEDWWARASPSISTLAKHSLLLHTSSSALFPSTFLKTRQWKEEEKWRQTEKGGCSLPISYRLSQPHRQGPCNSPSVSQQKSARCPSAKGLGANAPPLFNIVT